MGMENINEKYQVLASVANRESSFYFGDLRIAQQAAQKKADDSGITAFIYAPFNKFGKREFVQLVNPAYKA